MQSSYFLIIFLLYMGISNVLEASDTNGAIKIGFYPNANLQFTEISETVFVKGGSLSLSSHSKNGNGIFSLSLGFIRHKRRS